MKFGETWLDAAPAHWARKKLKYVASLRSGEGITADEIAPTGDYPVYGGNGLRGYASAYTHEGDRVLIGRQGALCGNVNYASGRFWASEHAVVAELREDGDVRWLGELLRAMDLGQYSQSAAQPGLAVDAIANLKIPAPPADEQRAIAELLDRETARLDALAAAKERLLGLLAEKRRALVTRAVTRGLDEGVAMRDSGVPWLGEVPSHWTTKSLRFACSTIATGGTPAQIHLENDDHHARFVWFTPADFADDLLLRSSKRTVAVAAVEADEIPVFPAGSVLVVGIGATLGKVGVTTDSASANQQINALVPGSATDGHFLAYALSIADNVLNAWANSATLPILNQQRMGDLPVVLPPLEEQHAIVAHIAEETRKLDTLRAATERTLALLRERRAALITAAVTGALAPSTG